MKMNIKKIHLTIISVFFILLFLNFHSIESKAYYDLDNDLYIPKGGEFVYEDFIYKVTKPAKRSYKNFRLGEVTITGINPDWDWDWSHKGYLFCGSGLEQDYPYNIVGVADYAFQGNTEIREFDVCSPHLRYIGKSAFEGCTNLQSLYCRPDSLTTIKDKAFYNCKSLKEVDGVGKKIKRLGKKAFKNTKTKIKIELHNVPSSKVEKIRKLFVKAGTKKVDFKLKYYKRGKGDPCH